MPAGSGREKGRWGRLTRPREEGEEGTWSARGAVWLGIASAPDRGGVSRGHVRSSTPLTWILSNRHANYSVPGRFRSKSLVHNNLEDT